MKKFTEEEFLKMGWVDEDNIDYILEMQEQLHEGTVKIRIEDVITEDEDYLQFLEEQIEKGNFNLEIEDFDMESFLVWVKDCEYALELDKCTLTDKDEKRWIIKNISKGTYFVNEKQEETKSIRESTIIYDQEDADSTIVYLNDIKEDAYVLVEY